MSIFGRDDASRNFMERANRLYMRTNAEEKPNREGDVIKLYDGAQYNRLVASSKFPTPFKVQSTPYQELRDLYKDMKFYLTQLQETESTGSAQRIVGKSYLNQQIDELKGTLNEIEKYAKEKKIQLDNSTAEKTEDFTAKVHAVKEKAQKLAETAPTTPGQPNEFLLTRELETERKLLLLKKTDVLLAKLQKIENLIGNKDLFKAKSVCAQFEEESNSLILIDPQEISHIIKKLDLVVAEVRRNAAERKMHYFVKEQKDELTIFLKDFFQNSDKPYFNNIGGYVTKIVELVETNAEVINEISELTETLESMRQLIEKATTQARENGAVLANLREQMDGNTKQIDDSLKALKK